MQDHKDLSCSRKLRELLLFSLWRRSLKGNELMNVYKQLMGSKEGGVRLFLMGTQEQDKGQWAQSELQEVSLKHKDFFSTVRMVKHWNGLPSEAVESPSLEMLKTWLDTALSNLY